MPRDEPGLRARHQRIDHGTVNGQFIWQFYPGGMGPDGLILDHVLALDIVGRATYVVEWNTGVTLAITIVGQTTDICAALSSLRMAGGAGREAPPVPRPDTGPASRPSIDANRAR